MDLAPAPLHLPSLHREFRHHAFAERGLKPNTTRDILAVVRRFCAYAGSEETAALTTPLIKAFLQHGRLELGWATRTYRLYRQYLKTFCDWLISAGYFDRNPVTPIRKPRLPQRHPRCLSSAQAQRILYRAGVAPARNELFRTRREAIVATFLMTGVRRSELLRLRRTDLDLHAASLRVQRGKGEKDRTIPLHPQLLPILNRYLAEKKRQRRESPWLFSSSKSEKPLTVKNLYAILREVAHDADVKFTPHMLRHTFGRELVEADFNIYKLKEIMGHASVTTTQSYVALSQTSIKRSFERTQIY